MKPPRFHYYDVTDVEEAVRLLAERGDEAKVLAGGQSLIPMMSLRLAYPEALVDVNAVAELDYIETGRDTVAIGALTRHRTLERSSEVSSRVPLLSAAMPWVAHTAIRNRGSIGGSLAHADPAAELPAVATALGATIVARRREGSRQIPIDSFFRMPLVSALEEDEMLTEVRLQTQPEGAGSAVLEVARRDGDFAIAGIVASLTLDGDRLGDVRLVSFATGPTPVRLSDAESELDGRRIDQDVLARAGRAASGQISPNDDLHATGGYRKRVTAVLVERAVREAADDAAKRAKQGAGL